MEDNWIKCYQFIRQAEGGNDDDPADHGGRTSRGITQREYNAWRREKGLGDKDVWTASEDEIRSIYHDEYWLPYCPSLPVGADYLLFNMAVNAGPSRGIKILQQALGVVPDGRIGPITREAIRNANPVDLIEAYSAKSRQFYLALHQPRFTRGWLNRVEFVRKTALQMVKGGKA